MSSHAVLGPVNTYIWPDVPRQTPPIAPQVPVPDDAWPSDLPPPPPPNASPKKVSRETRRRNKWRTKVGKAASRAIADRIREKGRVDGARRPRECPLAWWRAMVDMAHRVCTEAGADWRAALVVRCAPDTVAAAAVSDGAAETDSDDTTPELDLVPALQALTHIIQVCLCS